jgi:fumarate reductase flavoprotein subunit
VPLKYLADTVSQWNVAVEAGKDQEFGRGDDAPMHRIDTPKFYAASIMVVWHDSYGGLRINGKSQVVDLQGNVIPGLYAGGEASGGDNQHGLARAHVAGYVAGTHIHREFTDDAPTSRRAAISVAPSRDLAAAVLDPKV